MFAVRSVQIVPARRANTCGVRNPTTTTDQEYLEERKCSRLGRTEEKTKKKTTEMKQNNFSNWAWNVAKRTDGRWASSSVCKVGGPVHGNEVNKNTKKLRRQNYNLHIVGNYLCIWWEKYCDDKMPNGTAAFWVMLLYPPIPHVYVPCTSQIVYAKKKMSKLMQKILAKTKVFVSCAGFFFALFSCEYLCNRHSLKFSNANFFFNYQNRNFAWIRAFRCVGNCCCSNHLYRLPSVTWIFSTTELLLIVPSNAWINERNVFV